MEVIKKVEAGQLQKGQTIFAPEFRIVESVEDWSATTVKIFFQGSKIGTVIGSDTMVEIWAPTLH